MTLSLKHILNRSGFPELLEVHIGPCPFSEQVFASSKQKQTNKNPNLYCEIELKLYDLITCS